MVQERCKKIQKWYKGTKKVKKIMRKKVPG